MYVQREHNTLPKRGIKVLVCLSTPNGLVRLSGLNGNEGEGD